MRSYVGIQTYKLQVIKLLWIIELTSWLKNEAFKGETVLFPNLVNLNIHNVKSVAPQMLFWKTFNFKLCMYAKKKNDNMFCIYTLQ